MATARKTTLFDSRRTGNSVTEVDLGAKEVFARIGEMRGEWPTIKVGLFGDVADRAVHNEFGTRSIPERSFIRSTFEENREAFLAMRDELLRKILTPAGRGRGRLSVRRALRIMGAFLELKIKEKIVLLDDPPNAPTTIKKKGFDDPLRETDLMLHSVRAEIE